MTRVLSFFGFFILFFVFFNLPANASQNFSTDYTAAYNINQNANTRVVLNATLKNLTDKYYASSYSIEVGFTDIKNITASDQDGAINSKVSVSGSGSTITLNFNTQAVGLDKTTNFTIAFDTAEIAQNLNNVWNIDIPGISSKNDFSSFNVTVNYPQKLGQPTYLKPFIPNIFKSPGQLYFTKENLGNSGISVGFGDFQVYNYNLTYHLQNTNLFPISTEIALPPTTNYQEITIDDINPRPKNVKIDSDGNWLANYILSTSQKLNIVVKGKAKINLIPKQQNLSSSEKNKYLQNDQYWEVNDPKIKSLAKSLKTPFAIYQYVVKTLNYDFSRVNTNSPRLGAKEVLNNPNSAVCLEFTDLFVALARAAGIPAREVDGFAYSTNSSQRPISLVKDILHAWPEYYDFDKKAWVMVDPTWGNTTGNIDYFNVLDFNHIAFVIKGVSSNYPVPAGGYKTTTSQNTKDVNIEIGDTFNPQKLKEEISLEMPSQIASGLPISGDIIIKNDTNNLIPQTKLTTYANYLTPQSKTYLADAIAPFGHIDVKINFDKTPFLTNAKDTIKITLGEASISKNVVIFPFFANKYFLLGGIGFVSICIVISSIAYISWSLFIQRRQRQNNLRGESPEFKK